MNIAQFTVVFLFRLYQTLLSPALAAVLGPTARCRFTPSCSQYALEVVRNHGAVIGGWLALRRLSRCHPWGLCGDDPPPSEWKWPHWKQSGVSHVAQPSTAADSRTVPVRQPETGRETPPQPAVEDACATSFLVRRASWSKTHIHQGLIASGNCHGS
jgi:putative membrane protein insertion efficiency factor